MTGSSLRDENLESGTQSFLTREILEQQLKNKKMRAQAKNEMKYKKLYFSILKAKFVCGDWQRWETSVWKIFAKHFRGLLFLDIEEQDRFLEVRVRVCVISNGKW